GPTGLTLGSELYRHGVACRIIDALPTMSEHSRAMSINTRTLEHFDMMGAVDRFLELGSRRDRVTMYSQGKKIFVWSYEELDSPHPFILGLPQNDTERLLTQHLETFQAKLERGVSLVSLDQSANSVSVTLKHAN